MTYLCTGDLPTNDFLTLVETHPWPKDVLLIVFTPAEACFDRYAFDKKFLAQTDQGRIFSATGELQWRRLDQVMRVVYLGDPPAPENLSDCSSALNGLLPSRRQFLLWGERTETKHEWLEQQVPHRFSYPIDATRFPRGRAALVMEEWADSAGIPRFSRYHSIIEVRGGT
jgi:hypothetical protein